MVTGASTADLAVVLVDAREGMLTQSRRHAAIAALLGIPRIVLCVNKMDLVDWDGDVFRRICGDFRGWAAGLAVEELACIPVSALRGDNVVERSTRLDWYGGPTLLEYLEHAPVAAGVADGPLRLPVQWVIRPAPGAPDQARGYAGRLAGGHARARRSARDAAPRAGRPRSSVSTGPGGSLASAPAPLSVAVRLADELDVARGELLCRPDERPHVGRELSATVCWLGDAAAVPGGRYLLKHTTRTVRARLEAIESTLAVETLEHRAGADHLGLNEIGRVRLRTGTEVVYDAYAANRTTGSFILIDESTNDTVGAGMLHDPGDHGR